MSASTGYEACLARLEPKQAMFVREYLKDLNATQAAIRAGYSKRSARQLASRALSQDDIAEAVRLGMEKRAAKVEVSSDFVLSQYLKLASVDVADLFDEYGNLKNIHEIPPEVRQAISSVETETRKDGRGDDAEDVTTKKVKLWDKKSTLDSLARHLGMFKDNLNLTGALKYANVSDAEIDREIAALGG